MTARHGSRSFRVALTGGVATGKSTVADLFAALGVAVIDTDEIARTLTRRGEPAVALIAQTFGPEVLDSEGGLDRRRLRDRVFAEPVSRRRLEAILHPLIMAEADRRSQHASGPYHIIVVPLLFEAGLEQGFDRVLVVDAPESQQIERLRARDGESEASARRMLAAQMPRAERLSLADDVITNDGPRDRLAERVAALHDRYVQSAATRKK